MFRAHTKERELREYDTYRTYSRQAGQRIATQCLRKWVAEQGSDEIAKSQTFLTS